MNVAMGNSKANSKRKNISRIALLKFGDDTPFIIGIIYETSKIPSWIRTNSRFIISQNRNNTKNLRL